MKRISWLIAAVFVAGIAVSAQRPAFVPITDKTLLNPAPEDWLMYSRTYDAQRFSPLKQITRQNVAQLKEVFKLEFPGRPAGKHSARVSRRDVRRRSSKRASARSMRRPGEQIWEHKRPSGAGAHQSDRDVRRHGLLDGA